MTLQHVQVVHSGGKTYRYLRVPGQKPVRLPDLPIDHPAFLSAYRRGRRMPVLRRP